ncbi:class I SAM-dependent RNA methyltransferase [Deinococcus yavapaiensis]|uniref:23S rRNA (Uracil1939-C5)-methyltransferase n=1 Tax=Deinococcus yavapaiensis KR-236 TaxID=694435 RepID=A0A318S990_9DEIO|nr:methyltransferase domain-containing protein [Deinococcus yavapaiensis]PYE55781.1 23S rRNA (uracil1939-C5)-methyltransferase [Deinococcus yavapaiensis KR-236]
MLQLRIEKIVAGGYGLARDEGGVVLVAGALPGETVLADVKASKGTRRGVTREVLTASPDRVEGPSLPTMNLAHATYAAQLRYKRGIVQEALTRLAKLDVEVGEIVPSPREWAYRAVAQYLVKADKLAYREREGHAPVPVDKDPLVIEPLARFTRKLDVWSLDPASEVVLRGSLATGEVLAAVIGDGAPRMYRRAVDELLDAGALGVSLAPPAERRFSKGERLLAGEPTILERFGRFGLSVSATGFAQVNPLAAGRLYEDAAKLAGAGEHLLDLFGGAGGLGMHAASSFGRVTILDTSAEALERGDADAERLQLDNVRFAQGSASEAPDADVVIVDPPRVGLDEATRGAVSLTGASRLVYVSCDPATWARDVRAFTDAGWKLVSATPHDFYPQTSHVEVLSLLTR